MAGERWSELAQEQDLRDLAGLIGGLPVPAPLGVRTAEGGFHRGPQRGSIDGNTALTARAWDALRAKWHHAHGVTNVWREPAVRGAERVRLGSAKALHANQKPLALMHRIIEASSDAGDVVWEPFGGLCSASLAAQRSGRVAYAAELLADFHATARARLAAG